MTITSDPELEEAIRVTPKNTILRLTVYETPAPKTSTNLNSPSFSKCPLYPLFKVYCFYEISDCGKGLSGNYKDWVCDVVCPELGTTQSFHGNNPGNIPTLRAAL